jgi:hypothetical protein
MYITKKLLFSFIKIIFVSKMFKTKIKNKVTISKSKGVRKCVNIVFFFFFLLLKLKFSGVYTVIKILIN